MAKKKVTFNEDLAEKWFKDKKLVFRKTSDHFQLSCFLCTDNRERLGVNLKDGKWKCFNCHSHGKAFKNLQWAFEHKGNINTKDKIEKTEREEKCTIKPNLHVQFFKNLLNTKKYKAAKYILKERQFSKEAIGHFKLGARLKFLDDDGDSYTPKGGEHLAIPYLLDGKCVNIKYRCMDMSKIEKKWKWRREKGGISCLFNDTAIDSFDDDFIIITESELDTIAVWEMGMQNVVGLTTGAEAFKQSWYERLLKYKKIYLLLDNDEAGQKGAEKIARRLGMGRCFNVSLPDDVKDPNDYLIKMKEGVYDITHFEGLLAKADKFEVKKVKNLKQILAEIRYKRITNPDPDETRSLKTPWHRVNKIIGPIKPGFLFVLAGKPKSGKTTCALNMMKYWGEVGIPSGIFTCEMRDERLGDKWIQMVATKMRSIDELTEEDMDEAEMKLPKNIYTFYPTERDELDLDKVEEKVTEMVQRYGLKVMVIDNLHFLCRGDDENVLISKATQMLKLLAEKLDITITLITHPRKTNNNKQLKVDDLKGSSTIYQDADIVWLMHRPDNDGDMTPDEAEQDAVEGSKSPKTDIYVTGRWTEGGKTFLAFNGARATFLEKGRLFNRIAKEALGSGARKRPKKTGNGF